MKCVLVVRNPSMPDIVFMWNDCEFKTHLAKSAYDRGLTEPDEILGDLDISVVTQYFSPIIASHGLLSSEMNCPYSSITCNNDFIFVMKQFGQHLYITVNGDGEETEQFLHKKLLVFHRIIQFFYGAATEQLRKDNPSQRDLLWDTLGSVLDSWCELYHREQSFLLEALETLEVNQTLNELCIGLLESVLLKFKSAGDKNAAHAMLITGAKLLQLYSSRNAPELHQSDVLLIVTLARSLFPAPKGPLQEIQDEASSQRGGGGAGSDRENRQSGVFSDGEFMSAGEGGGSDGSQYYSPANTHEDRSPLPSDDPEEEKPDASSNPQTEQEPIPDGELQGSLAGRRSKGEGQRSGSTSEDSHTDSWCDLAGGHGADTASIPSIDCTPGGRVPEPPNSQTIWYTPIEGPKPRDADTSSTSTLNSDQPSTPSKSAMPIQNTTPVHETGPAPSTPTQASESCHSTTASLSSGAATRRSRRDRRAGGILDDAAQMMVFLQQSCPYSPHVLHVVRLLPSITLVVVSEINNQVATWVSNCLKRLSDLLNALSRKETGEALQRQSSVGKLDADLKQLGNAVKKSRIQGVQQVHTDLIKQWTVAKGCGLTTNQGSSVSMAQRLESILSEMGKTLKTIFTRCYVHRNAPLIRPPSRYLPVIGDVRASLEDSLTLYHEYLAVRAERNITMTNYLEDFPGLVHFVHVNRTTDKVLAPSINISCESEHVGGKKKLLQEKVWSMVEECHEKLQQGIVMETVREGDFTLSYLLYFEDPGGLLVFNRGLPKTTRSPVPGILAGKYFREVVAHAFPGLTGVTCCELFCIHLSVVPSPMIANHIRRLRIMLRSGDAIAPVTLL
ncbi:Hermansky-Pudlak syndrome 1 protein homolog [Lytechinus variegatus]|uniref:Hermansky-Pudlak syndrome 1 protein homolog n=1 Tax=Lytechinus variegatus TaxID=7654 RepID=UPI001BB237DF|nr:Hermansky-Pudlak syndrome 1 protein homolog [Lytechinus variegatus]